MQVCIRRPEASTHAFSTSEELLQNATGGIAQVFRYWDRVRGDRVMPARTEIDFLELRPWLAGIVMTEVVGEPREIVYRVVGERAIRLRGYDPTGMTVARAGLGRSISHVLASYGVVIDLCIPLYGWSEVEQADGGLASHGTLLLPVSGDGRVDWVLGYVEDAAAYDWAWAR